MDARFAFLRLPAAKSARVRCFGYLETAKPSWKAIPATRMG